SCLAKQTMDRPDSMETVAERLGEIAEDQGWLVYELQVPARSSQPRVSDAMPAVPRPTPIPTSTPAPPAKRRRLWPLAAAAAAAVTALVLFLALGRSHGETDEAKARAELAIADQRIAGGRLVAQDGDDALAHLLSARRLDPNNAAVGER